MTLPPRAPTFMMSIRSYIFASGTEGATPEEIASHLGLTPQIVGEAINALASTNVIVLDGTRDCGLIPDSPVWKCGPQM